MGHENASKCSIGNGSPATSAAQMVRILRAKQLIRRCLARCLLFLFRFSLACGHLLSPPEAVYHFSLLSGTVVLVGQLAIEQQ